jgi:hypothetical protein
VPQQKLALTWGDVLAIALVALLGAGAARLASALVDARMRDGRPSADAYREREAVELREGDLARARDAHDAAWRALVAHRIEAATRRAGVGTSVPARSAATFDSAARIDGALNAEVASAAAVAAARREALALARRTASRAYRADSTAFEDRRATSATLLGALAAAIVVVLASIVLSAGAGERVVHPRRIALVASAVLVLVLGYRWLVST